MQENTSLGYSLIKSSSYKSVTYFQTVTPINLVKKVQLNTNPTQSSQNSTSGTGQPTSQNPNSTPSFRGKGGRGRGRGRGGSDLGQVKSCAIGVKSCF